MKIRKTKALSYGIALIVLASGCRKDCQLRDIENFRIEESGNKKDPCYYVLTGITLDVKDITGVKNLENEINKSKALQNSVMNGTPFEYADIKTVKIGFSSAIVTTPNDYSTWQSFAVLPSKFSGIQFRFTQNGHGVVPRDDKTPLEHSEWKKWWFNSTYPLQLSVNPWSGAKWQVNDRDAFIKDGCDPSQLTVPKKDTIGYDISSIAAFENLRALIQNEVGNAKQGNGRYLVVNVSSDLGITAAQKPLVTSLAAYGTDKATYPDSIFSFRSNGTALYPTHAGIKVSHGEWGDNWNNWKLKSNADNGEKFTISCKDEDKFKADGQAVNVFNIDQTDCTGNDTIKISSETALTGAPQKIEASLTKPLTNTFVQFTGGGFGLTNGSGALGALENVLNYADNGDVTFIPAVSFGGIYPATDSVDVRGKEGILGRANQKGLCQATTLTGGKYWFTDEAGKASIPMNQVSRLSSVQTSTWRPAIEIAPVVNMNGEFLVNKLPEAYYNGTFPMQVKFIPQPGSNLAGVTDRFCRIISMPAVPDVNKVIQFETNPQMGRYVSSATVTHSTYGADIDTVGFGPGTSNSGAMYLASYYQYGNGQYLQRTTPSNSVLKVNTSNPAFFDDGNLVWHVDSIRSVTKAANIAGTNRMNVSNTTIYIPVGHILRYYIDMGGTAGEAQVCNDIKITRGTDTKFTDTATDWYRPDANGYYAMPNNSLTPRAVKQFKYHKVQGRGR